MRKLLIGCMAILTAVTVAAIRAGSARQGPFGPPEDTTPVDPHDVSGLWLLTMDSRQIPQATLLPTVTKADIAEHEQADKKAVRYCNLLGVPYLMDPGLPIDVQEGHREIVIFAEISASPRHIYLDRDKHIDSDIFDPTTNGDSIGHWDGDTLVVDTVGFHPSRGILSIPGGGYKTDKTHLVEHFKLLENGKILSVQFTWTDPTVYKVPHTYEFHYYKLPAGTEPLPGPQCSPYDDIRTKFLGFTPDPVRKVSNVPGAR